LTNFPPTLHGARQARSLVDKAFVLKDLLGQFRTDQSGFSGMPDYQDLAVE